MKRLLLLACLAAAAHAAHAAPPPATEAVVAPATEAMAPAPGAADASPADAARLRQEARAILDSPEFRRKETATSPVMRDWLRRLLREWFKSSPSRSRANHDLDLTGAARVFKYLALVVLALAVGWLLWRGWQWLAPRLDGTRPPPRGRVLEARSLLLADTPLPAAVAEAARAAWAVGDALGALSLLYRGALRALATQHRIALPDSATEEECLRLARRSGAPVVAAAFAPIVQAWMALAYGRRLPADPERLLALYREHFEATPEEQP
ncbi:MAG TPA: hypothetical protein VFV15_06075 [Moraxellaceae bacterium]|nr:hypothetical protein [Moraxellaceae bacterium]